MTHLGRTIGTIVGASVLLLVGSACGESNLQGGRQVGERGAAAAQEPGNGQQGSGSATGKPGGGGDEPVSSGPGEAAQLPPEQVREEDNPRAGDQNPPVWVLDNGRAVRVTGVEGGCSKAAARVAEQGPERVRISIVETVPTRPGQHCTMDMRFPKLTVRLDEPLGERTVVIQRATSRK